MGRFPGTAFYQSVGRLPFHKLILSVLLTFSLFSCMTTAIPPHEPLTGQELCNGSIQWETTPFPELEKSTWKIQFPDTTDRITVHCYKINLESENIKIKIFPSAKDELKTKASGIRVSEFSKMTGSQLAFNTTPFSDNFLRIGKKTPLGLTVSEKEEITPPLSRYAALGFFKNPETGFSVRIFQNQTAPELSEADYAAGGFWQILKDGKEQEFRQIRDARTAAGTDFTGKILFILIVESRKNNKGLSYMECARLLKQLGAENAMEFDGGSSSCLYYIEEKKISSYGHQKKLPAFYGFHFF